MRVDSQRDSDVAIADSIGAFDWLAKLTANRRAVFVASGCGSQLIAAPFQAR